MSYDHLIRKGALLGLAGFVLSGPVAVFIVMTFFPQPEWTSVPVFVEQYHPMQNLPYFLGFILLSGMVVLTTGHFLNSRERPVPVRFYSTIAFASVIIFSALIAFNYICQTTFVHNMARHYRPEYDSLIAGFSMSNPESFCWANEMWGYAFLGIGTWLLAPYYAGRSRVLSFLLIGNGIISFISPVWTIADPMWVMRPVGFGLYFLWNVWMIVLMIVIYRATPVTPWPNRSHTDSNVIT